MFKLVGGMQQYTQPCSCLWLAAQTLIIVCMTCANVLLPVTVQMRCESRPAFLNAYLRLLSSSRGDTIGV